MASLATPTLMVGLERLAHKPQLAARWGSCGLVCNQASVDAALKPSWRILHELLGGRLRALFGPQHGFAGTAQDNMIETAHSRHIHTNLPVFSLYSETREPTDAMLEGIDTLIVDLQIVGCRIYTWKSTIAGCLRSAKRNGKRVVILDRPNPVGGVELEGRVLDLDAVSFVGQFPTPMRHGLTAGEAAQFFNATIGAELEVVPVSGWNPASLWGDWRREWVLTSPNLPTPAAMYVYPGTVMFEGTNISEGRGTGLPFQFLGAPYIKNALDLIARVKELVGTAHGVELREVSFEPTSQKWQGQVCNGLQIHVMNPAAIRSFGLSLAIIEAFIELGETGFEWKKPPYEYDNVTLPMKLIVGSHSVEQHFGNGRFSCRDPYWGEGIERYIEAVKPHLIYERTMRDATFD